MKTLTLVILLALAQISFSQNTTQEEYNFMTKGYKTLIDQGLDMKKGYYLGFKWVDNEWTNYKFTFLELRRETDKSLAGTIIKAYSKSSGNTYYYGIPAMDCDKEDCSVSSKIDSNLKDSLWELDGTMTDVMFVSFAKYISIKSTK